jgi:hypothetical protein
VPLADRREAVALAVLLVISAQLGIRVSVDRARDHCVGTTRRPSSRRKYVMKNIEYSSTVKRATSRRGSSRRSGKRFFLLSGPRLDRQPQKFAAQLQRRLRGGPI